MTNQDEAWLGDAGRTFVIAEIGSNHDGDFGEALRLMDVAAEAGADAVKFQSFLADHLVSRDSPDYELLRRIELPREWYPRLKEEAAARRLEFFSTATNEITLGWLQECGAELYKIASPNLTHLPLIRTTAAIGKPLIMSTGMASMAQIDEAVQTFLGTGNRQLALLHCVSEYPARPEAVNLRFIQTLSAVYPFPIGFSDHTLGIGTAIAAVALGARIIEKHVTADRTRRGPDHHYALEPNEFVTMTRNIREVEMSLGSPHKVVSPVERDKADQYWRTLHAAAHLPAGTMLTSDHIKIIRPNDGLHARHLGDVVGMRTTRALDAGAAITWTAFQAPHAG
jgi:sialic acid synthase SpsE